MALLTGGALQQWEIKTTRLWLFRVAGKLTKGGRQLTLKLPGSFSILVKLLVKVDFRIAKIVCRMQNLGIKIFFARY
jgi:hypothetical protein